MKRIGFLVQLLVLGLFVLGATGVMATAANAGEGGTSTPLLLSVSGLPEHVVAGALVVSLLIGIPCLTWLVRRRG